MPLLSRDGPATDNSAREPGIAARGAQVAWVVWSRRTAQSAAPYDSNDAVIAQASSFMTSLIDSRVQPLDPGLWEHERGDGLSSGPADRDAQRGPVPRHVGHNNDQRGDRDRPKARHAVLIFSVRVRPGTWYLRYQVPDLEARGRGLRRWWRSRRRGRVPIERGMEIRVSLEYPNGRIHTATVERDRPLLPGDEFQMHGRHWRAVARPARPSRSAVGRDASILCRSN